MQSLPPPSISDFVISCISGHTQRKLLAFRSPEIRLDLPDNPGQCFCYFTYFCSPFIHTHRYQEWGPRHSTRSSPNIKDELCPWHLCPPRGPGEGGERLLWVLLEILKEAFRIVTSCHFLPWGFRMWHGHTLEKNMEIHMILKAVC